MQRPAPVAQQTACLSFADGRHFTSGLTQNKKLMNKSTFCLNLIVPSDIYEFVLFKYTKLGMLGCEEQNIPEGVKIRVYFKDEETARKAAPR
jgi:hypothetical protein